MPNMVFVVILKIDKNDTLKNENELRTKCEKKNAENDSENAAMTPELISKIQVHLLSQYGLGLVTEANQKETAKIRGFIKDIRQFINASLEDLEIANDLTVLETANDNYEKAYMARVAEKAAQPASTVLREATESAFLALSYLIATLANNPSTEQADMMHARLCERLINELNVLVKDFKQKAYSSSTSKDDEEEDDNDDVDDNVNPQEEV